jgi:hypothetical protein
MGHDPRYSTSALNPMAVIRDTPHSKYINCVCVTPSGAWIISYTSYEVPGGATFTQRSTDRGRTWGEPALAYDGKDHGEHCSCEMGQLLPVPAICHPEGAQRPRDLALGVPNDQTLHFVQGDNASGAAGRVYQFHVLRDTTVGTRFGRLVYTISEDGGPSWRGPNGANSTYAIATTGLRAVAGEQRRAPHGALAPAEHR